MIERITSDERYFAALTRIHELSQHTDADSAPRATCWRIGGPGRGRHLSILGAGAFVDPKVSSKIELLAAAARQLAARPEPVREPPALVPAYFSRMLVRPRRCSRGCSAFRSTGVRIRQAFDLGRDPPIVVAADGGEHLGLDGAEVAARPARPDFASTSARAPLLTAPSQIA
jgi:hypothetical protein